jgi:hypothetical protein
MTNATTEHYDAVREFMQKAGQKVRLQPELGAGTDFPNGRRTPTIEERTRAVNLILEEAGELCGGLGFAVSWNVEESVEGPNFAEAIDGVFDLQVVSTCVLVMLGVPDATLRKEIDENNLAKFGPGHSIRDDGKLIKPKDHKPVDILATLAKVITRGY